MAFWTGVERGMAKSAASALADEELELRKVSSEREGRISTLRETDAKLSLAEKMGNFSNLSSNNSSFKKTSSSFKGNKKDNNENSYQQNMAILSERFNVSKETVATIYAEGGPQAIANLTSLATDIKQKLSADDYVGNTNFDSIIGNLIDSRITTESSIEPIDFSQFADAIKPDLLNELESIAGNMRVPDYSEVSFGEVNLVKSISPGDLNNIYAGFDRDLTEKANFEMDKLNTVVGLESTDPKIKQWTSNRLAEIQMAVDSLTGSTKNYGPILGYYGSNYFNQIAADNIGFDINRIPQSYIESANRESSVMDVETPEFFNQLLGAGLIPKGQMVRYELSDANITKLRMENGNEYVDRLLENGRVITEVATRGY